MSQLRTYEVTVIVQPDLDDDARKQYLEKFTQTLTHGEGEEAAPTFENWGKRQLAFPIRKYTDAYYLYFEANLDPGKVRPIEQSMNYDENILRYLFVRKEG